MSPLKRAIVIAVLTAGIVGFVVSLSPHGGGSTGPTPTPSTGYVEPLRLPVVTVGEGGANGVPFSTSSFPPGKGLMDYASSKAGFPVTVPGYLPTGYLLTEIDIPPRPPAAINSSGLPLFAVLKISNGSTGFRLQEANVRFSIDQNPSQLIASPSTDTHIFKDAGDLTTNYTFASPTRVIDLTTGAPNPLTDDEAVRILTSVP